MGLCSPHRPFQPLQPWPLWAHLTPRYRPSPGLQPQSATGIPSRCSVLGSAPSPMLCPLPRPLAPQACEVLTTCWRPPGRCTSTCYGARAARETRPCHRLLYARSSSSPPHSKLDMDSHPPSVRASASLLPRQRQDPRPLWDDCFARPPLAYSSPFTPSHLLSCFSNRRA